MTPHYNAENENATGSVKPNGGLAAPSPGSEGSRLAAGPQEHDANGAADQPVGPTLNLAVDSPQAQHPSKMLQAARWYAQQGIPIFPCRPGGKEPLTRHGYKEATANLVQVNAWWSKWPDANIGMPTGSATALMVIDCDPRNGGPMDRAEIISRFGPIPDTAEQITGGGGRHILFRHPGVPLPKTLEPGTDLKGEGGYILVAPSIHPSGDPYRWDGLDGPKALFHPAETPVWLIERISSYASGGNIKNADQPNAEKISEGGRNNYLTSIAGTMRRRGMSKEAIEAALLEENRYRCDPPLPEAEVRRIAMSVSSYSISGGVQHANVQLDEMSWPVPSPLQSELPPVESFSPEWLPGSFCPMISDVAERMQVPIDYPAVASIGCLAGCVNRRAIIQPKANDCSWIVVPNLWGGIVGPPGILKSPAIHTATRPLITIEEVWRNEHKAALDEYESAKETADLRHTVWKEQYKQASKRNGGVPIRPDNTLIKPVLRRLLTNDATFEALHYIMSENPAGILVIRDELTGWWSTLDKPGREGERAFALEAWNGDSSFTIDRIGRGTVYVPHCCMSMLGGIQPARLRTYLVDAIEDGPGNDGLVQRFQVLVWPDIGRDWTYVDRAPDTASEALAIRVFSKLVELDADDPLRFRFSPKAQELFIEWLAELEAKIRAGDDHPALVSHLSKYRSLMPSLALLFELADRASDESGPTENFGSNEVSLYHAKQAAAWCAYLESHARRVYSCITTPELRAARELADKIKKLRVGNEDGVFSCRDVYLKGWTGLTTPDLVKVAADVLVDAGWLRELASDSSAVGGRPSNRYQTNPRIKVNDNGGPE